jgi:hypothetical protein
MGWTQDNTSADADDMVTRTCTGRCGDGPAITIPCPPGTDPFINCGSQPPRLICVPRGEVPPLENDSDTGQ